MWTSSSEQGYVYVLTTVSVLAVVYLLLFALSKRDGGSGRLDELSPTAVVMLVLIAAFIFEPLRNWIQQQLDRHVFYRDHYDHRRTLIVFATLPPPWLIPRSSRRSTACRKVTRETAKARWCTQPMSVGVRCGIGLAALVGENRDQAAVARIEIEVAFRRVVEIGLLEDERHAEQAVPEVDRRLPVGADERDVVDTLGLKLPHAFSS